MGGNQTLSSHLQSHTYPDFLMRFPHLIRLVYRWNSWLLQRNQVAADMLESILPELEASTVVLDAGCGEGMHILPNAEKYRQLQFYGIDKNDAHIVFIKKYIASKQLKNVEVIQQDLQYGALPAKPGLVICIGTLQYIADDMQFLKRIFTHMPQGAIFLLYVPVNGRMINPLYRYFYARKDHYDSIQQRKRIYTPEEISGKLKKAGFAIREKVFTYGSAGIAAHEVYSLLLLGIAGSRFWSWFFYLVLLAVSPLLILILRADLLFPKKSGNGVLFVLSRE